jgi:hypothetical protein
MAIDEVFNTVEGDSEWKEYVTEERIEKGLRYTQIDEQVEAKLLAETSQEAQQPPVAETPTTSSKKAPDRRPKAKRAKQRIRIP